MARPGPKPNESTAQEGNRWTGWCLAKGMVGTVANWDVHAFLGRPYPIKQRCSPATTLT